MESCWECLGIDPTADTAAIKKAYAKQLKFNKPDKNPEGFLELRAAYEQALNESWWYEEQQDYEEEDSLENNSIESDSTESAFVEINPVEQPSFAIFAATAAKPISLDKDYEDYSAIDEADSAVNLSKNSTDLLDDDLATDDYEDYSYKNEENSDYNSYDDESEDSESDDDSNNAELATYYFESSAWAQEWQQVVGDTDAVADSANHSDQRLQTLLQSQLETPRSLDEQKDYEEELLVWFDDNPPLFVLSYQLAKSYFRWNERLEHWSRNDYPWYRLESLDQSYQQVSYFQSPAAFYGFLTKRFPMVASYWTNSSLRKTQNQYIDKVEEEPIYLNRSDFIKRLFFPFRVTQLAQELKTLDAELDYYIHDHPAASDLLDRETDNHGKAFTARYWQQESSLKTLKARVFDRFIEIEDFGSLALFIALTMFLLAYITPNSWTNFFFDGLAVFLIVSLYYLFWQLQLRLFATPEKFVSYESWSTGWCNASILFFILGYISWLDIANLDTQGMPSSPVYFLTQLAGASLFAAYSMRQDNIVVKAVTWYAGFLLLIITVLVPLLVFFAEQPPYEGDKIFAISPLFWLLLTAPAFLVNISDTYTRLEWLANIGYKLLNIWGYLIFIGVIIVYAYCVDILYEMHFGFTAVIVMMITIITAVSKSKFLNSYDDEN